MCADNTTAANCPSVLPVDEEELANWEPVDTKSVLLDCNVMSRIVPNTVHLEKFSSFQSVQSERTYLPINKCSSRFAKDNIQLSEELVEHMFNLIQEV